MVDDPQWEEGVAVENSVDTDRPGGVLERMTALVVEGRLFLAVEGSLADGDVLLVYVDGELGAEGGVSDFGDLLDEDGTLDSSLSHAFEVPAGFGADVAFGTTTMPRTAVGLDDAAGWRNIADSPGEFTWLAAEGAPLVCSSTACEASIALDALPGAEPREIAVFARIGTSGGGLTNQTLPEDDPSRPGFVSLVLVVADGEQPPPDAGVGDAGVVGDAGPPSGPIIDGVVGLDEWAGALVETSSRSADGTPFAGNALRTMRAIRDAERLYLAIEGELVGDNAILMYVDADVGGADGLTMSTAALTDFVGALDQAFSTKSITLPAELRIDLVWGTMDMSRAAVGIDDRMGWRDVALTPGGFVPVSSSSAPTVCSVSACETSIRLVDLGARAAGSVGIFVRLGSTRFETLSNQTLPSDLDPIFAIAFAEVLP